LKKEIDMVFDPFGGDDSFGAWLFEHSNDEEEDKSQLNKNKVNRNNNYEEQDTMECKNDSIEENIQEIVPPSTTKMREGVLLDLYLYNYGCDSCTIAKPSPKCLYYDECKSKRIYDHCSKKCVYARPCVEKGFCDKERKPIILIDGLHSNEVFSVSRDTSIVFKGLYLGMDIDKACEKLNEILKVIPIKKVKSNIRFIVHKSVSGYQIFDQEKKYKSLLYDVDIPCALARKEDKIIYRFSFLPDLVDSLFNVSDMNGAEFTTEFSKAYKIPIDRWIGGTFENQNGLRIKAVVYEDRVKGWAIFISSAKHLLVKLSGKMKSAPERKFD
jgi:hypothetical protein